MKPNPNFIQTLSILTIMGNGLFILWVTFNAAEEGFEGTLPEKFSYVFLLGLLITNIFLIINFNRANRKSPVK